MLHQPTIPEIDRMVSQAWSKERPVIKFAYSASVWLSIVSIGAALAALIFG